MPKILFVAMIDSTHTVRWIKQLEGQNWDIYIFPAYEYAPMHKGFNGMNVRFPFFAKEKFIGKLNLGKYLNYLKIFRNKIFKTPSDSYAKKLSRYIYSVKPDLVHSLETQLSGYLLAKARSFLPGDYKFPKWWHTNWGSDLTLYTKFQEHIPRIKEVLENCNYYSCECTRDIPLAKEFGFKGTSLPVYPNAGGFDIQLVRKFRTESRKTSLRKLIMLKGYQGWAGRALVGIRALERSADILKGYEVVIFSNTNEDIQVAAKLLAASTGIRVTILPKGTAHEEILRHHSGARISIGLSISDGISTSLLEAMAMGSFPIQSGTACAADWIKDGETGIIVPAEDPEEIEKAIRKALTDDIMVDGAAEKNLETIISRADFDKLRQITVSSYKKILEEEF